MGKYRLVITEIAKEQIKKHYKSGNKGTIKKLEKILLELSENPYTGIGNPEALKNNLSGFWSRKINQKDRLIYSIDDDIVIVDIVSAMGHYFDK